MCLLFGFPSTRLPSLFQDEGDDVSRIIHSMGSQPNSLSWRPNGVHFGKKENRKKKQKGILGVLQLSNRRSEMIYFVSFGMLLSWSRCISLGPRYGQRGASAAPPRGGPQGPFRLPGT